MPRSPRFIAWILFGATAAYALTLTLALFGQEPGRLNISLGMGLTGGWPGWAFLARGAAALALTLTLGAVALGQRVTAVSPQRAGLFGSPERRLVLVSAPLLVAPLALLQDDITRRGPLVALCVGLSVALGTYLIDRPEPSETSVDSARVRWLKEHGPMLVILAAHAVIFARLTIVRDRALWSATVDLGIFKEALWNTLHGRPMHSSTVGYSFLGEHFAPVLFLLAPLYALSPTSDCLLIVQALAISVSGWPMYLLGRDLGLGRALSTALATAMIFAPTVQGALLYDFHMDLLAVPAMAWLALAAHRARWAQATVAAALMVATKEDMFVPVLGVLVAAALTHSGRNRTKAVALGVASVAWCFLVIVFIFPKFGPPEGVPVYMADVGEPDVPYKFLRNYRHLSGHGGPFWLLLTRPFRYVLYALSEGRLTTLMTLVLPLGALPFLAGRRLSLVAPAAIVLFSDNPEVAALRYHYGAIQHPGMYAAAAYGAALWVERSVRPDRARAGLTSLVVASALVMAWMHPSSVVSALRSTDARAITAHTRIVQRLIEQVPPRARVSVTSFGGPRFSNRPWVGLFPSNVAASDWALVDMQRPAWPAQPPQRDEFLLAILRSSWSAVDWEDGAILFRRVGGDRSRNLEAARDLFARRRYEVEGTEWTEFSGDAERDPTASDGWARVVRPTDPRGPGWVVFGPFAKLPAGRYTARFRLRVEPSTLGGEIGAVDVHGTPEEVLAVRRLTPADFPSPAWQVVALPFTVAAQENLEFRVFTAHRWVLGADVISVAVDDEEEPVVRFMLNPH